MTAVGPNPFQDVATGLFFRRFGHYSANSAHKRTSLLRRNLAVFTHELR